MSSDDERVILGFKALAHPVRYQVVRLLGEGPRCVREIEAEVGSSQSNVSQHLGVLREAGIVEAKRQKNEIYYQVSNWRVFKLLTLAEDLFGSP